MSASNSEDLTPTELTINELFDVMSEETRRRVLYYLREHGGTADVDELEEHLADRTPSDPDEVGVLLYHMALPKLDEAGIIEYESSSDHVRYVGSPLITELLEWVGQRARTEN